MSKVTFSKHLCRHALIYVSVCSGAIWIVGIAAMVALYKFIEAIQ